MENHGNQFSKANEIRGTITPTNPEIKGENCAEARKNAKIFIFMHKNIGRPTKKPSDMATLLKIRNFCAATNDLLAH